MYAAVVQIQMGYSGGTLTIWVLYRFRWGTAVGHLPSGFWRLRPVSQAQGQSFRTRERAMFYLTTHSTHFIYGYMASDMVKHHSDSERGNLLPAHRLLLLINSKGYFIGTILQTG